jgi:hypothetical protein
MHFFKNGINLRVFKECDDLRENCYYTLTSQKPDLKENLVQKLKSKEHWKFHRTKFTLSITSTTTP